MAAVVKGISCSVLVGIAALQWVTTAASEEAEAKVVEGPLSSGLVALLPVDVFACSAADDVGQLWCSGIKRWYVLDVRNPRMPKVVRTGTQSVSSLYQGFVAFGGLVLMSSPDGLSVIDPVTRNVVSRSAFSLEEIERVQSDRTECGEFVGYDNNAEEVALFRLNGTEVHRVAPIMSQNREHRFLIIHADGTLVFLATNAELVIADVSQEVPRVVLTQEHEYILSMCTIHNGMRRYIYLIFRERMLVMDVTDPANPVEVRRVEDIQGLSCFVDGEKQVLYVLPDVFSVVNAADPTPLPPLSMSEHAMYYGSIVDDYVIFRDRVYNRVSPSDSPVPVHVDTGSGSPLGEVAAAGVGSLVYGRVRNGSLMLGDAAGGFASGFREVGTGYNELQALVVDPRRKRLYTVGEVTRNESLLEAHDISTPEAPRKLWEQRVGYRATTRYAYDLHVCGESVIFISAAMMGAVNVEAAAGPAVLGSWDVSSIGSACGQNGVVATSSRSRTCLMRPQSDGELIRYSCIPRPGELLFDRDDPTVLYVLSLSILLEVWDVTEPHKPYLLSRLPLPSRIGRMSFGTGRVLFLHAYPADLFAVDVTDPSAPNLFAGVQVPTYSRQLLAGNVVVVNLYYLHVIDVSSVQAVATGPAPSRMRPSTPSVHAVQLQARHSIPVQEQQPHFSTFRNSVRLVIHGGYVFVATDGGLHVVRREAATLVAALAVTTHNITAVAIEFPRVVAATKENCSLLVFDVSDPEGTSLTGSVEAARCTFAIGTNQPHRLAVTEGRAYWQNTIVDISDPAAPAPIRNRFDNNGVIASGACGMAVQAGSQVLLRDLKGGFEVDGFPVQSGAELPQAVVVRDGLAFVIARAGLEVFALSDGAVSLVGVSQSHSSAKDGEFLAVTGCLAFVGNAEQFWAYNITVPRRVMEVEVEGVVGLCGAGGGSLRGLAAEGRWLYALCTDSLHLFEIPTEACGAAAWEEPVRPHCPPVPDVSDVALNCTTRKSGSGGGNEGSHTAPAKSDDKGTYIAIGVSVGAVVFIALVASLCYYYRKKKVSNEGEGHEPAVPSKTLPNGRDQELQEL